MIHYIEANQINEEVLKNDNKLVVINFYATWCVPCEQISDILTNIEKRYYGEIEVYKVNAEDSQDITMRYNITSVPTTIFFKCGEEIERIAGVAKEENLTKMIEELK